MQAGQIDDDEMGDIVDEEEFRLMKRQREAKKQYRAAYEDMQTIRSDMEAAKKEADVVQAQLLTDFEQWHETTVGDEFQAASTSGTVVSGDDKLDDQEAFEKLEIERVVSQDPEQLAFFQAQKTRRANATQNSIALKQMHKNKRNR